MPISEEERWKIVSTWKTCKNISGTARSLGLSRKAVERWVKRYIATHGVSTLQKTGRRPALSKDAANKALELLLGEECRGASEVALHLQHEGFATTTVHKSTIIRVAKAVARQSGCAIHAVRGKPGKRLTQDTKCKRLQFCKDNLHRSWSNVMFTDRKKFLFSYPGAKVSPVSWLCKGKTRQATCVNHPQCVNLYAGITRFGITACHLVAGTSKQRSGYFNKQGKMSKNITASEYQDVVKSTFLPEGGRIFSGQGMAHWVLQQDNDPTHRAAMAPVLAWSNKHATTVAILGKWPPNSPDLNPIENIWAYIQGRVNQMGCKSFEDFKEAVLQEVASVPQLMLNNLYKSLPKRMAKAIEFEGDKTKY